MKSALKTSWQKPYRVHIVVGFAVAVVALFLFVHPDIVETANHSWLFLDSVKNGRFFEFYNDVSLHQNTLYYTNNAHYNIFVYFLLAVVQLPYYIVCQLAGAAPSEAALTFLGKGVCIGFWVGCAVLTGKLAGLLGLSGAGKGWPGLFLFLWPPAFFAVAVMGQYDAIGLFFTLLGLYYWMQGRLWPCVLWFGAGIACKFFPLFVLVPLLLLREKRVLHLLGYGAASLWLVAPTSLLFLGRTGDMGLFNQYMAQRLFDMTLWGALAVFPVAMVVLCALCYVHKPAEEKVNRLGLWLCLCVFGLFFLTVYWHPQWILYLAPFVVLTTFLEKRRTLWFWLDFALAAAFFVLCAFKNPTQLEANLFDQGVIGLATGLNTFLNAANLLPISHYYNALIPLLLPLCQALFYGALAASIILKLPVRGGSVAGLLAAGNAQPDSATGKEPFILWALWGGGLAVWLLPTVFTWLNSFGFV